RRAARPSHAGLKRRDGRGLARGGAWGRGERRARGRRARVLVVARAVRARRRAGPNRRRRRSCRARSRRETGADSGAARAVRGRAFEAAGRLAVQPSEDVEIAGPWKLTLDSLGAGATSTLRLEASTETRRDGEAVEASTIAVSATADVASDGRVTRVALDGGLRPLDRDVEVRAV